MDVPSSVSVMTSWPNVRVSVTRDAHRQPDDDIGDHRMSADRLRVAHGTPAPSRFGAVEREVGRDRLTDVPAIGDEQGHDDDGAGGKYVEEIEHSGFLVQEDCSCFGESSTRADALSHRVDILLRFGLAAGAV